MITRSIIPHNSEEWYQARLGKFTASKAYVIMKDPRSAKNELAETAETYLLEVVAEGLTGLPIKDDVSTIATAWGHQWEPEAFAAFEALLGKKLISNVYYESDRGFSGSPDGEDEDGSFIFDIKCPYNSANHVRYLGYDSAETLKAKKPEYYWQLVMNMMLSNAQMAYFVSFDPRFPLATRLKTLPVPRIEDDVRALRERLFRLCDMRDERLMGMLLV